LATIALCGWPLPGSISGILSLAARLRDRGHRVCIISIADAAPVVAGTGLPFEPVFTDIFPRGFLVDLRKRFASLGRIALLRETRQWTRRYENLIDALLSGRNRAIDAVLDRLNPDLILLSSDVPHLAVIAPLAWRRGIPIAYVTPLFFHYANRHSPPLSSPHVPRPGQFAELRVRLIWLRHLIAMRLRYRAIVWLGLDMDMARILRPLSGQRCAGRLEWRSFLAPLLRVPEFFLHAEELDFPAPVHPGCHRIGFAVRAARADSAFPWHRLDPSRKLLLCSLGTLLYLPLPRQRAVLQAVIDAAAERPDWQLVMATGAYLSPESLRIHAPDTIVMEHVPQVAVLQRAALMITHAGVNSMHECAVLGVPMVLLPIAFDQAGCAARAVYHGLGLRGDVRRVTEADIGRLIDAAAADAGMAERCAAMAARLRHTAHGEAGLRALEALVRPS